MTAPQNNSNHPHTHTEPLTLHCGNNVDVLRSYPDCHFDAIVTDPPYGIEFLGKAWDSHTGAIETWQQCLRVLKPGGHLLAFSAARTYHNLATNIESVGFEIRDQLMWIYSSGFPKAQDIGKAIDKRGGMISNNSDTKTLKTLLAKLFKHSGKTKGEINEQCGFNAAGYLRQHDNGVDGWGYALPLNEKWHTLKKVLNCSDDYDKYFVSSERPVIGTTQAGCFDSEFESHTIGARSKTVDITAPATTQANQWHGWKTALKPGHEPIVMARRPFKGSTIDNVIQHGVGALNIDSSRIPYEDQQDLNTYINNIAGPLERSTATAGDQIKMHEGRTGFKVQRGVVKRPTGGADGLSRLEFGEREPIKYKDQKKDNLAGMRRFTGSDSNTFARINPEDRDSKDQKRVIRAGRDPGARLGDLETQTTPADHNHEETPVYEANPQGRYPSNVMGDIPDYQKYFYCPKVSRRERHAGFEQDHLPKRLIPMPGENGLKDIYDCYDKDWANKKDLGKKSFNPLTDSAPHGSRRCSTDSHERWHQGMEHKKGNTTDPLAHIPTNPNGMYDVDGTGVMYNPNKKDSLAHLPTESSMLAAVGGYYVDAEGNRTETAGKNIWTPDTGMVYVHGLTKIYQQWCQTHNKTAVVGNNHPTVKPVALMRYLIQLVTPVNSIVLDPFMGSGSTGMAARELGHTFVGIDLDPAYVEIAQKRITGWCRTETTRSVQPETATDLKDTDLFDDLFE